MIYSSREYNNLANSIKNCFIANNVLDDAGTCNVIELSGNLLIFSIDKQCSDIRACYNECYC